MKMLDMAALLIGIIGCLNWGLIGIANFNLVNFIFGGIPFLEMIIYLVVGLSGIITKSSLFLFATPTAQTP